MKESIIHRLRIQPAHVAVEAVWQNAFWSMLTDQLLPVRGDRLDGFFPGDWLEFALSFCAHPLQWLC